jgi:hypothetical protein
MELNTHPLDRTDVEQIAYQAIAHQFRLPALFSVVLMVVGFVLGHYVASSHLHQATDVLEQKIAELNDAVRAVEQAQAKAQVASTSPSTTPVDVAIATSNAIEKQSIAQEIPVTKDVAMAKGAQETASASIAVPLTPFDAPTEDPFLHRPALYGGRIVLSGMETAITEPIPAVVDTVTPAVVTELREEVAAERSSCLAELAPYVEKQRAIPASMVESVIESVFAEQDRRLESLLDRQVATSLMTPPGETAADDPSFRAAEDRTTDGKFPPVEVPAAAKPANAATNGQTHRFFPKPRALTTIYFSPSSKKTSVAKAPE